jgi:hypothetical protein
MRYAVVLLGLLNMLGYITGASTVSRIGFLSAASPLPLVFTDRGTYEDFAATYRLEIRCAAHRGHSVEIDKRHLARLAGPFDRRGAYASAFVYAPLLDDEVFRAVAASGFCSNERPLAALLVPEHARGGEPITGFTLTVGSRTRGRELVRTGRSLRCPT